jgi:hypothetical protein
MEDALGGACNTRGAMRNAYILVGKPEGKKLLRRPRRMSRWECDINLNFKGTVV